MQTLTFPDRPLDLNPRESALIRLGRRGSCKWQQATGFLICKPEQSAIFKLYPLSGILSGPRPEHSAENLRLALTRNQKNHISGVVQYREGEGNAESLKLFHPVGRHPA